MPAQWEDAPAAQPAAKTWEDAPGGAVNTKAVSHFDAVTDRLKGVAGEGAAILDLAFGAPGFLIGTGAAATAALGARMRGVPWGPNGGPDPVTAWTVGREASQTFGEPLTELGKRINPLRILLSSMRSGEHIEQSKTNEGMAKFTSLVEKAGKWVEDTTGGQIGRDAVPMLVDTLMAAAPGAKGKGVEFVPEYVRKAVQQHAEKMRQDAELEIAEKRAEVLTPGEAAARVPVQQQINDMLGIRSPAEQAKVNRARRKQAEITFGRGPAEEPLPPELEGQRGREYGDAGESAHYADERIQKEQAFRQGEQPREQGGQQDLFNEAPPERIENQRVGQAEVLDALKTPGEERSPAQLDILRQAAEAKHAYDAKELERAGSAADRLLYRSKERGKASPEAMMLITAAGLGGLAGEALDDDKLRGAVLGGLTGAGLALPFMGRGPSVPSSFKQGGAVKGPGGMWHPEAVERLDDALTRDKIEKQYVREGKDEMLGDTPEKVKEVKGFYNWSNKAIRNYLNRYAGTEKDPLKDVEIPSGEGVERWGDTMDAAIKGRTARDLVIADKKLSGPSFEGVPADEMVWGIKGNNAYDPRFSTATKQLESHLSHVGDYLRQNVDPAKLQQYDLVRAVKETAENDKRVAKEMEKAAAASTKDLPVYKEYPDGMKWVELKLPEKLTPEQAKTVRLAKKSDPIRNQRMEDAFEREGAGKVYVATDATGKPIKNAYTEETAVGTSPEEAYLAGRLAEEGNQMGHCVGGYCEGVASGESKIYSLRDAKGKSHVTIEVTPAGEKIAGRDPQAPWASEATDSISQIKGKQNRAPNKEYLPYVQDFVKSGKWGEVRELDHTGLQDLKITGQNSAPFRALHEELFPGERFLDEAQSRKLQDVGMERTLADKAHNQRGSIDQQLLMGLGAVGLGGLLGSQLSNEPGSGALLGALAGGALRLPGVRRRFEQAVNAADYGLGVLSTRIGHISPAVLLRARTFEMRNLTEAHERLYKVAPFMKALNDLKGPKREALDRAILTNDAAAIAEQMKGNPALVSSWREVRNTLREIGEKLQGYGRFKSMREDYFPRLVKDVEGLKNALSVPVRTRLEQRLAEASEKAAKTRGTPLSNIEESAIINQELMGNRQPRGYQPGYTKARGVEEITKELQPYYYTPAESLYSYIRGATFDLEAARFFGKDLAQRSAGGAQYIDLDASIGNVVGDQLRSGKITHPQAQELIKMLQSRFRGGERSSSGLVQDIRNLGNAGLLGNIVSAATQVADALMSVYAQDLRSSLSALASRRVSTKDFGLADHVAEEFISASKTSDWLNKMLKYSGFSGIDTFGKNQQLRAALDKYERLADTPAGVRRIQEKYGKAYGDELPALVRDLRAGNITERVRSLLFSELSDMQPISKLELPQGYLDNPNGRLLYMLKSFMLKQADVARRDVYDEFKKGNIGKALKNGTEYALVLGISGAATDVIKNWLMGRKVSFDQNDVAENILKTFGLGEYVRDKMQQGKPIEALLGAVVPPYKMMDEIIRRDPKAVQYIPIIGKLFYNWELGGREEAEIRDVQKARRKGREVELSERSREYAENKRERAKERREREGR